MTRNEAKNHSWEAGQLTTQKFQQPHKIVEKQIRAQVPSMGRRYAWLRVSVETLKAWSVQFSRSLVSDSLQPHGLQASLSIINSQSLVKLMSIESMMPSNHLILSHPLLLMLSVFPSIRVFSNGLYPRSNDHSLEVRTVSILGVRVNPKRPNLPKP